MGSVPCPLLCGVCSGALHRRRPIHAADYRAQVGASRRQGTSRPTRNSRGALVSTSTAWQVRATVGKTKTRKLNTGYCTVANKTMLALHHVQQSSTLFEPVKVFCVVAKHRRGYTTRMHDVVTTAGHELVDSEKPRAHRVLKASHAPSSCTVLVSRIDYLVPCCCCILEQFFYVVLIQSFARGSIGTIGTTLYYYCHLLVVA